MDIKRCQVTVSPTGESLQKSNIHGWFLDWPTHGTQIDTAATIQLRGWAAAPLGTDVYFVLRTRQRTRCYPCTDPRQDVMDHFANAQPPLEIALHCGFHHDLQAAELFAGVELGLETRGVITWVVTITAAMSDLE